MVIINSNAVISRKEFQVTLCCPPIARKMDLTPANAVEKREGAAIKNISCMAARMALSELWVFQEKVDMKVSAFSFNSSLLIFGYL